jgi:hypothetical protein
MSLRVRLYTIWYENDLADVKPPCSRVADLAGADGKTSGLFLGFANGCFLEARAIGESPAAIEAFRRLIAAGGYRPGLPPAPFTAWLYQDGDESFPEECPFVFLAPTPDPSLAEAAVPPKPQPYHPNFWSPLPSEEEWWQA